MVATLKEQLGADGVALIVKGGKLGNAMVMQYATTEDAHELCVAIEALAKQLRQLTEQSKPGRYGERLVTLAAVDIGKKKPD